MEDYADDEDDVEAPTQSHQHTGKQGTTHAHAQHATPSTQSTQSSFSAAGGGGDFTFTSPVKDVDTVASNSCVDEDGQPQHRPTPGWPTASTVPPAQQPAQQGFPASASATKDPRPSRQSAATATTTAATTSAAASDCTRGVGGTGGTGGAGSAVGAASRTKAGSKTDTPDTPDKHTTVASQSHIINHNGARSGFEMSAPLVPGGPNQNTSRIQYKDINRIQYKEV